MLKSYGNSRRTSATALVAAASLALAACGDDEKSSSGGGSSGAPQKVSIKATGSEKAPAFEVTPASVKAGAATIEVENALDKGGVDGQLVLIAGEHSDEEIAAELVKAVRGKAVADWFQGGGGPGEAAKKGAASSVTQELKAGTYAVLSGEGKPKLPLTKIEVKGEGGPKFEPPAAKVTATEYAFKGEGVKSGEPVLLENGGSEWHHFLAAKLNADATIGDAKKFLMTEKGKPPFEGEGPGSGFESTVLDGGISQTVEFEGKPGKYAFFCFIADKKGGPPHVVKGMVSEVVVE